VVRRSARPPLLQDRRPLRGVPLIVSSRRAGLPAAMFPTRWIPITWNSSQALPSDTPGVTVLSGGRPQDG
jgi:hypothetical protein